MPDSPRLALVAGIVCGFSFAALASAADEPKGKIRVEAVVQKYETGAMEDVFADGRFVAFDAVTLSLVSPAEMATKTICVNFEFGSVADNSPLRQPGRRCRFDFDKDLLRDAQLFQGALENLAWISAAGTAQGARPGPAQRPVDSGVLAAIEKELARLDESANREAGPDWPRPSRQVAYYLLAGLAQRGVLLEELSEAEQRLFEVEPRGGIRASLMSAFTDVRVALFEQTVQDKAGSYVRRTAVLYVQQNEKWLKKGQGSIAE